MFAFICIHKGAPFVARNTNELIGIASVSVFRCNQERDSNCYNMLTYTNMGSFLKNNLFVGEERITTTLKPFSPPTQENWDFLIVIYIIVGVFVTVFIMVFVYFVVKKCRGNYE